MKTRDRIRDHIEAMSPEIIPRPKRPRYAPDYATIFFWVLFAVVGILASVGWTLLLAGWLSTRA